MSQFYLGVTDANIPSDVATSYVTDNGTAVPIAHVLNVLGINGATTSAPGSSNTIYISVGFNWLDKSTSFNAANQTGYFCTASLTAVLPLTPSQGTTITFFVDTSGVVTVEAQGADQIQLGSAISVGGLAQSNTRGSVLELTYRSADATWHTTANQGTWSIT